MAARAPCVVIQDDGLCHPKRHVVGFEWFVRLDQNVEAEARNGGLAIQIENPAPERSEV